MLLRFLNAGDIGSGSGSDSTSWNLKQN